MIIESFDLIYCFMKSFKICLIVIFFNHALSACRCNSELYSLYADFHLEKSALLLDNEYSRFVFDTWGWSGTGKFVWSAAKDTLILSLEDSYKKTWSSSCECVDSFQLFFLVKGKELWEIYSTPHFLTTG